MTPVKTALRDLGKALGLSLSLSPQGTLQVHFGNGVALKIEAEGEAAIHAYTVLGPCPPDSQQSALFAAMLEAQLFGRETGDARFGLDAHRRELLLHQRLDLRHLDPAEVKTAIEGFVGLAKTWIDRLAAPVQSEARGSVPQAEQSVAGPWLRA